PLSQVFSGGIPYAWQEAVALVQQLADQVTRGLRGAPGGSLPDRAPILLDATGQLHFEIDPHGTEPVVRGLAVLLHRLLTGRDGPINLRLTVSQIVSGSLPIRTVN